MTKLLNIDTNAKTVKGQSHGYLTAVMYLAPFKAAGINVCPMAEIAGCVAGCLNTAGRGGISRGTFNPHGTELPDNHIQRARIRRTRWYAEDRDGFIAQLRKEIAAFVRKAERKSMTPVVRLNGTSDIQWERVAPELFSEFSDVQFYDYTKIAKRLTRKLPDNYHLSLSYSEATTNYMLRCIDAHTAGASLIIVVRDQAAKDYYMTANKDIAVDGDAHDLRFLDKPGSLVYLKAKGQARKDQSGFVIDYTGA